MDAFEEIIEGIFQELGYWTRAGYKVKLSKAEKVRIGKPTMPRPEIDILAYKPSENLLLWVECKSYLDSNGVRMRSFDKSDGRESNHYKIFTNELYRDIISAALLKQVVEEGLTFPNPALKYCLVAGKLYPVNSESLREHFKRNGWLLYDKTWIIERLRHLSTQPYENNVAMIVAKLFERT